MIPLELPDKGGQGALWGKVRSLSNALVDAVNRKDYHEVKTLERRLDLARKQFHALYNHKEPSCQHGQK